MHFPEYRPRRLRRTENLRRMIRQTRLSVDNLLLPLFVRFGSHIKKEISSMPGNFQVSPDVLVEEAEEVASLGIPAIMLFGIPEKKDGVASGAYAQDGIIQEAVRAVKAAAGELIVVADTCLCEYTDHGHCGVLTELKGEKYLDNDRTLKLLAKTAVSQAASGADMVAPSAMIDGQVQAIRESLDEAGFDHIPIMSYAAKYASAFYGPFREAAESPPKFGDRRSHQMDPANSDEALREVALDIEEGADIVMVKPALAYLDVIYRVKHQFGYPVAAYNVSGEFAAIKAAAQNKWLDEKRIVLEVLTAIKRAGADIILTYFAKDVARWLKGS